MFLWHTSTFASEMVILMNFKVIFTEKQFATSVTHNFGTVNSATTAILIKVQDIEDENPEFVQVPSVTRIAEDVPTFTEVIM